MVINNLSPMQSSMNQGKCLHNLNEEKSEEENYSRTVSQGEPRVVRRNQPNERDDRSGCKYKDFMESKPSSLFGIPTLVEVMD